MRWHEITIHTMEEATEAISDYLHELGAGGVSIEESGNLERKRDTSLGQWYDVPLNDIPEGEALMKAYFSELADVDSLLAAVREHIAQLPSFGLDTGKAEISIREVQEEDWANAWKQYYKPLRISDKLTVKPTWETYEPAEGEMVIELDPGMAFGTGTHPTTSLCLRTLESVVKPGDQVIDVGTGSGVLAIASAKLGAEKVLAIDLDPVAVSSAMENVRLNDLAQQITVAESDLLGILKEQRDTGVQLPVRVVVANILAEIILKFIDDVYAALQPGGVYIVSGIYVNKEEAVEDALKAGGFSIERKNRDQDWIAFVAVKQEG